jgi:hypothetical protein
MKQFLTAVLLLFACSISFAQTASVTLTATGTDKNGTVVGYKFSQVSGPNTASISSPNSSSTVISNLIVGTYKFQCVGTDNEGATGIGSINVFVKAQNIAPVIIINGGLDTTIQIPGTATGLRLDNSNLYPINPLPAFQLGTPNTFLVFNHKSELKQ